MKKIKSPVSLIILVIAITISLVPLYVMIVGSLKLNGAFFTIPPSLLPNNLTFQNYKHIIGKLNFGRYYINSLFISITYTALTVLIGASAGYAFAKKNFLGKSVLFVFLLCTMMLPFTILMVPNFMVAMKLNLIDKLMGVVLTTVAAPAGVFLCKQFMQTLPDELMDAVKVDGCNELKTFLLIVLPLSKPVLASLAIFNFIRCWNNFIWQNIMLTSRENRTMTIAVAMLTTEEGLYVSYQIAGAALSAIPILILFLFFQKYFIKGLTLGAVKG